MTVGKFIPGRYIDNLSGIKVFMPVDFGSSPQVMPNRRIDRVDSTPVFTMATPCCGPNFFPFNTIDPACNPPIGISNSLDVNYLSQFGNCNPPLNKCLNRPQLIYDAGSDVWVGDVPLCFGTVRLQFRCDGMGGYFLKVLSGCMFDPTVEYRGTQTSAFPFAAFFDLTSAPNLDGGCCNNGTVSAGGLTFTVLGTCKNRRAGRVIDTLDTITPSVTGRRVLVPFDNASCPPNSCAEICCMGKLNSLQSFPTTLHVVNLVSGQVLPIFGGGQPTSGPGAVCTLGWSSCTNAACCGANATGVQWDPGGGNPKFDYSFSLSCGNNSPQHFVATFLSFATGTCIQTSGISLNPIPPSSCKPFVQWFNSGLKVTF